MFGIFTSAGARYRRSVATIGLVVLTGLGCAPPVSALQLNLNKLGDVANALVQSADGLKEITEEREIELGKGIAARLLGAVRLDTTPGVQEYVNQIGHWLIRQTERPNLPWRFGVLDSSTVNAFAAPGGYVFITRGLLLRMTSEAELAGVLGHEIAHVLKRHHLEAIRAKAQRELAVNLVSAMADNNSQIMNALIGSGMELYSRGLDREDEYEADLMGVVLLLVLMNI
jgi:predicted Zn-dependent protease